MPSCFRSALLLAVSAGDLPLRFTHRSKSFMRTWCMTVGSFTTTNTSAVQARLLNVDGDDIGRNAIHDQHNGHFAGACEAAWDFDVHLIEAL